jgi:hypothetical protein
MDIDLHSETVICKPRRLKCKWTCESTKVLWACYSSLRRTWPELQFDYIRPIRWHQFWRYRQYAQRDYILSRADEIITAILLAKNIGTHVIQRGNSRAHRPVFRGFHWRTQWSWNYSEAFCDNIITWVRDGLRCIFW